nr:hypothetical protein GCM10020092_005560 [Actinoplanes digitatis]
MRPTSRHRPGRCDNFARCRVRQRAPAGPGAPAHLYGESAAQDGSGNGEQNHPAGTAGRQARLRHGTHYRRHRPQPEDMPTTALKTLPTTDGSLGNPAKGLLAERLQKRKVDR